MRAKTHPFAELRVRNHNLSSRAAMPHIRNLLSGTPIDLISQEDPWLSTVGSCTEVSAEIRQ